MWDKCFTGVSFVKVYAVFISKRKYTIVKLLAFSVRMNKPFVNVHAVLVMV